MSIPFFKTKKEAQELWGPKRKVVKVFVPKERGFLQAPRTGKYWIWIKYAKKLHLNIVGK